MSREEPGGKLVAGKLSGKGSDNVETQSWLQPTSVLVKKELQIYRQGWQQMRFSFMSLSFFFFENLYDWYLRFWCSTVLLQLLSGKHDV